MDPDPPLIKYSLSPTHWNFHCRRPHNPHVVIKHVCLEQLVASRHTAIQAGRQTDKWTNHQTDKQMEGCRFAVVVKMVARLTVQLRAVSGL